MSTPTGITRVTCTSGTFSALESGIDLGALVTVASTRPYLVWEATGEVLLADPYTVTVAAGEEISIPLIPTDLTGWTLNGLPLDLADGEHSHGYNITVQATVTIEGSTRKVGSPLAYSRVVVPADTVGSLDLDTALVTTAGNGGTITLPSIIATLNELLAALDTTDTALTAVFDDLDSAFRAALLATNALGATFEDPTYDGVGNLTAWIEGGIECSATYDPATGNMSTLTVGDTTRTFTYDSQGRLEEIA